MQPSSSSAKAPQPPEAADLIPTSELSNAAGAVVFAYFLLGMGFYTWAEGWSAPDALYFAVTTFTTVGFGDFVPSTELSKAFTIAYILTGISIVASCLGILIAQLQSRLKGIAAAPKPPLAPPRSQRCEYVCECARVAGGVLLIIGVGAGTTMLTQGWSLLDGAYFAVVTCASVGFGDLTVGMSGAMHAFMAAYMLIGVSGFALCAPPQNRARFLESTLYLERARAGTSPSAEPLVLLAGARGASPPSWCARSRTRTSRASSRAASRRG